MLNRDDFIQKLNEDNLILIANLSITVLRSGCDVWLIPYHFHNGESFFNYEKKYLGDDWSISNETVFGYKDEPVVIAMDLKDWNYWQSYEHPVYIEEN